MDKKFTYKDAGVDIEAGDQLVVGIKNMTKNMPKKNMLGGLGGFGGAYELLGYKNPVLVSGTDGVGTKLKLAFMLDKHDTVGIDLVAMCVNDIITGGALPLFFLDYFATGKLKLDQAESVISGIVEGCKQADCVLLGGETAEMPDFYADGEYDLAGFTVGVVEKEDIIDGREIKVGDIVIGVPSTGVHSNGFSMVRKIFNEKELAGVAEELLVPTRIYVKDLRPIIKNKLANGFAHITGGGLTGNIPRVLPGGLDVVLEKEKISHLDIFKTMQEKAGIEESDMFRVFNMGIGMVIIAEKDNVNRILSFISDAKVIGEVILGDGKVILK
ncbi:MAG: phosphoribosylformylglycinamidine cyclo-ligase [bacterium]|nr:phosphoribosylformylglycinamidine cyclo-ligase [bacterium]